MDIEIKERVRSFLKSRWLVFVASMWIQSCSGIGYMFGSISPYIKTSMGYNQRQIAVLGVAKDIGDSIGFVAGFLCEILPIWGILLIGVVQNFIGYGLVWLSVTGTLPSLPLWVLCISIFVGTNGETYFNTGVLVSCVQNFPKSRGPVVGILKGFAGLSGAILTQIYAMINFSDKSGLIFMIAVGPSMVIIALMFIVRPVGGHRQIRSSDGASFFFVYAVCLLLAAYLLGVMILNDLVDLNHKIVTLLTILLLLVILIPIFIPIMLLFSSDEKSPQEEGLICSNQRSDVIFSEVEDEKPLDIDLLSESERRKRIAHLQSKLFQAAAEGAVRLKRRRKGPRRGEDFTLRQALIKADFWLIFFSLVLASGSGLTVIDNLGQICQSLGYYNTSIYVSMISIWNFLGRVGGGYFSEIIVRKYSYPRAIAMTAVQVIMAIGLFYYSMGWAGEIYVLTILTGLGYGAHWAIVPAAASELFGLKSFGSLYNFLTLASPVGSLVFSGIIASGIYDHYAEKQRNQLSDDQASTCEGIICYSLTFGILSGMCLIAVLLSSILVHRTKIVYANLRS